MSGGVDIRLEKLGIGYRDRKGSHKVCPEITATLRAGTFTALLGRNGAGKSTLLRTLCGFQQPVSGEIIYGDRNLAEIKSSELGKMVGVVLTERVAVDNMTSAELVAMGRNPYTGFFGRLSDGDRETVAKALEMVGATDLAHRRVNRLSDGERQKVLIAKALAQETPAIYLDEPTAFLDYPTKHEIMQLLARLATEQGKSVLMSTHDIPLALQTAHHIWLLDKKLGLTECESEQAGETIPLYFG